MSSSTLEFNSSEVNFVVPPEVTGDEYSGTAAAPPLDLKKVDQAFDSVSATPVEFEVATPYEFVIATHPLSLESVSQDRVSTSAAPISSSSVNKEPLDANVASIGVQYEFITTAV